MVSSGNSSSSSSSSSSCSSLLHVTCCVWIRHAHIFSIILFGHLFFFFYIIFERDYDTWQELSGSNEWGWNDMQQYFDQSLDYSEDLAKGAAGGISFEKDEVQRCLFFSFFFFFFFSVSLILSFFFLFLSFFLILLFSIKSHRPNGRISVVKDVNGMLKNKDYLGTSWMILKMPASNQEYQVAVILIRAIKKVAVTFKSTNVLVNTSLFSTRYYFLVLIDF